MTFDRTPKSVADMLAQAQGNMRTLDEDSARKVSLDMLDCFRRGEWWFFRSNPGVIELKPVAPGVYASDKDETANKVTEKGMVRSGDAPARQPWT